MNAKGDELLFRLREGGELTSGEQLRLIARLSLPAILAQLSTVVMQYIDASMVGSLGAADSAGIGLVASSTWLIGGLCSAAVTGFTVLTAQAIGAKDERRARNLSREAYLFCIGFSLIMAALGVLLSGVLPVWLGGSPEVCVRSSAYFLIYSLALPAAQLCNVSSGMLQASGNMRTPGMLHVLMCLLDVVFNALLIFPRGKLTVFGMVLPGAGLGVEGAALGTALAEVTTAALMLRHVFRRSPLLRGRSGEKLVFSWREIGQALRISVPVGIQQAIMSGAQIMSTGIVTPLGTVAIASNSLAVTAEGLCYMPGYGIATAATTLIGQSIGAKRHDLVKRMGWFTILLGMAVMTLSGVFMYLAAPIMIGSLSPVPEIRELGAAVLRIEAFAEPFFAASIVAAGVFRGAGDTLYPSVINLVSMWAIRLPLAAWLAPKIGLHGVWMAMCIELCARGVMFLIRMAHGRWVPKHTANAAE